MSDTSALLREYERLQDHQDPHRRGYDLQALVGSILGAQHFKVETKPRPAGTHQVDLFASRGDSVYLIETKWRKDKANITDIDSLYVRLDAVPSSVLGLLVSHAGFAQQVIDRVRTKSARPVLLVTGKEIEAVLQSDGDLVGLLHRKESALLVHGDVLLVDDADEHAPPSHKRSPGSRLPSSNRAFVFRDGARSTRLQCRGGFGEFTFIPELQDIDWTLGGGFGVTLDVRLPVWKQRGLVDLLRQLAGMGWVTAKGCWSIQQATANWHGFGADALAEALGDWKTRYTGLQTHHTEELCYFDECEDGFFSLVAQISADARRRIWRTELSFQLAGIPVDSSAYRELCSHFEASARVYFRPRKEESVRLGEPTEQGPAVTPIAYVVTSEGLLPGEKDEWVSGIVVQNPFFEEDSTERNLPAWVPNLVAESEYLVCALRSWHTLAEPKPIYELWNFRWAWTSDALAVRPLSDWPDDPKKTRSRAPRSPATA